MSTAHQALDNVKMKRLIEIGGALVSNLDLESLLQQVVEAARELTGARYAALGVLDERHEHLERFIATGVDDATRAQIGDLPQGRGVLGLLINDPRPLRLSDVGRHPDSYGFPAGHPPMKSFLGVPIMISGEVFGNLYLTEKAGGEFDERDEEAAVTLASWTAIAIHNARLYTNVESRRDELERAVAGLEATIEIALALGGETDIDRVLELIVKRGRALVEARAVLILLADGKMLRVVATAGEVPPEIREERIPIEGTLPGTVLVKGDPELIPDVSTRLRLGLGDQLGPWAKSAILEPLIFRGQRLGVIVGFDRTNGGPQFSVDDERLLRGFAASAATAVATARSVQEDRLRSNIDASERERRRWARELHDETLQALAGLQVLHSSALRKADIDALTSASRSTVEELNIEISNLRSLIAELRPAALDEIGLEAALDSLLNRATLANDVQIESEIELTEHVELLGPDKESTVYRLAQEALTNVSKHAVASHVWVRVAVSGEHVEISVRDDGVGFDPDAEAEGFGLIGMRERATLAGGELEVYSAKGSGTTIRALIPLERDKRERRAQAI